MIETANLDLREMSRAFLAASLEGDAPAMASALGATPAEEWPDDMRVAGLWLQRAIDTDAVAWGPRAVVLRSEERMIGHAGFHGPPGAPNLDPYAPGGVELGYTIYPAYRGRRFAAEACQGLMYWAAQRGVTSFVVTISPNNTASLSVARRLGFGEKVGSHDDPDDGLEEIYVLHRTARKD